MSWGTSVKTDVYCRGVTCGNKTQVEDALEECNAEILYNKNTLFSLACCTPNDGYPKSSDDDIEPLDKIRRLFDETFDDLQDLYSKKERLEIIKEAIEDGEKPVVG